MQSIFIKIYLIYTLTILKIYFNYTLTITGSTISQPENNPCFALSYRI